MFAKYHYLNNAIDIRADHYVGIINKKPVSFIAIKHFPHPKIKNYKRVHRLVVLPDYQGIGIGIKTLETVMNFYKKYKMIITTSTPALLNYFKKSNIWKLKAITKNTTKQFGIINRRRTTTWEFNFENYNKDN